MSNLQKIKEKDLTKEEVEEVISHLKAIGLIVDDSHLLNSNFVKKIFEKYPSKFLADIIKNAAMWYEQVDEHEKLQVKHQLMKFLLLLGASKEQFLNQSLSEKGTQVHVVIFPAQQSATDFILDETYLVGGEAIERRQRSNVLSILAEAAQGNYILLILDELTETLKRDIDKRPKNIHSFLDAYINNRKYNLSFSYDELGDNEKKALEILKEKGFAEKTETGVKITFPPSFYIVATGNERAEDAPIGFTESTWNRLIPFHVSYPSPEIMGLFIDKKLETVKQQLMSYEEEIKDLKLLSGELEEFGKKLKFLYNKLYKEYKENPNAFRDRMLPTYRNIDGAINAFISYYYYYLYLILNSKRIAAEEGKVSFEQGVYEEKASLANIRKAAIEGEWVKGNVFPKPRLMGDILVTMLEMISMVRVGSYTDVSELMSSKVVEFELESSVQRKLSLMIDKNSELLFRCNIVGENGKIERFYYSLPYFTYLLYMTSSSLFGDQKFFLLTGTTQEGKSTMVSEVLNPILEDLIGRGLTHYEKVEFVHIPNKDEVTLQAPQVEKAGGKKLKEPLLLNVVRQANENKRTLYIILIDEIDSIPFSQHLNHLLTRDEIEIEGKTYHVGNIKVIGTSNISATMLDNFVSRAILPLLFLREVGKPEIHGTNLDSRSVAYIDTYLRDLMPNIDEKDINAILNRVVEAKHKDGGKEVNILQELDFHEVVKSLGEIRKEEIGSIFENIEKKEMVDAISELIIDHLNEKLGEKKRNRRDKRGI
jgi:hypothetical protein